MTAHDLVAQWFGRHQAGVPGHLRYVTLPQIELLRELAEQDEEGGSAVRPGLGRSFSWMPSGRWKYVIAEDPRPDGRKHTITRLASLRPSGAGSLF